MNKTILLPTLELESSQGETKKSIIWLHGLGADGNDFAPIVKELNLPEIHNMRFIFPTAPAIPVTINSGYQMPAWFDIHGLALESKIDEAGITKSVHAITALIEKEIQRGVDTKNIILAGFSQGAVIALIAGLSSNHQLGGIIALSTYFPLAQNTLAKITVNKNIPIFMAHGTEDGVLPFMLGLASYNILKNAGLNISWHTYRMAHSVCPEEIKDLSHWINQLMPKQ